MRWDNRIRTKPAYLMLVDVNGKRPIGRECPRIAIVKSEGSNVIELLMSQLN